MFIKVDLAFETVEQIDAYAAKNGLTAEIIEFVGPAGGWPFVKLSGTRDALQSLLDSDDWSGIDGIEIESE